WTFIGPSVSTLMTTDNGGSDTRFPAHIANPQAGPVASQFGVIDAGNASGNLALRKLPSNLDVLLLHDVYNYHVVMPEQFGTFYAMRTIDATGNPQLLVRGKPDTTDIWGRLIEANSRDVITLRRDALTGQLIVSVDIGDDVPGIGPTDAFVSTFD